MSRMCSVCIHASRGQIDRELVSGRPLRDIAGRFQLSKTALDRHRHNHLAAELSEFRMVEKVARGSALLDDMDALLGKASALLLSAEASGDTRTALAGVKEARACIELLAKLEQSRAGSATTVEATSEDRTAGANFENGGLNGRKWTTVCQLLRDVLVSWPTLANSVAGGLRDMGLDSEAAMILSEIPETLRIERVEDPTADRRPSRPFLTKDLENIRIVLLEELHAHPEVQRRIVARLRAAEASA